MFRAMESEKDDLNALALSIKRARLNAGLTQAELARRLATSGKRVGRWEKGEASSLGDSPEARFAVAAQVAAATGDMSLIGLADPSDESELLILRRDVDRLSRQVARLAETLVEAQLLRGSDVPQLLEQLDANDSPPAGESSEGQGP
jgi:transcriptional regulator with XRE-family HTH domain